VGTDTPTLIYRPAYLRQESVCASWHRSKNIPAPVGGSFVTTTESPRDLDVCIDTTGIDYAAFKKEYPEFFSVSGLRKFQRELKCHFQIFDSYSTEILDYFRFDRNGDPKGVVKISIKEIK